MKLLLSLLLLGVAASKAAVIGDEYEGIPESFHYHKRFGIAQAAEIKEREEKILNNPSRIVGGTVASIGQFPYQAGIVITMTTGEMSACGASLVSNTKLLTAAHCWYDGWYRASNFEVVLGSDFLYHGGVRKNTSNVVTYPYWYYWRYTNDMAVITIDFVQYTTVIQPVALPRGPVLTQDFTGFMMVASGYGRTSTNDIMNENSVLSYAYLTVITNVECRQSFGQYLTDTNICTSGATMQGTCSGDSGGPLVVDFFGQKFLIGTVSYGSHTGCAVGGPSSFARVSEFMYWIDTQL